MKYFGIFVLFGRKKGKSKGNDGTVRKTITTAATGRGEGNGGGERRKKVTGKGRG